MYINLFHSKLVICIINIRAFKLVFTLLTRLIINNRSEVTYEKYKKKILDDLKFMTYAPILFISAKSGQRVDTVLDKVKEVYEIAGKRITTGILNDVLNDAVNDLQPPIQGGKRLKIYYATQGGIRPPSFVLFVNEEKLMQFSYQRYLENYFRKSFDFTGTPIRFILREKKKED